MVDDGSDGIQHTCFGISPRAITINLPPHVSCWKQGVAKAQGRCVDERMFPKRDGARLFSRSVHSSSLYHYLFFYLVSTTFSPGCPGV